MKILKNPVIIYLNKRLSKKDRATTDAPTTTILASIDID